MCLNFDPFVFGMSIKKCTLLLVTFRKIFILAETSIKNRPPRSLLDFLDFITFGFIPAPNTMFQNLFSLEPGSYKEFSFSNQKILEHDTVYFWEPKITNEIDDFLNEDFEKNPSVSNQDFNFGFEVSNNEDDVNNNILFIL